MHEKALTEEVEKRKVAREEIKGSQVLGYMCFIMPVQIAGLQAHEKALAEEVEKCKVGRDECNRPQFFKR